MSIDSAPMNQSKFFLSLCYVLKLSRTVTNMDGTHTETRNPDSSSRPSSDRSSGIVPTPPMTPTREPITITLPSTPVRTPQRTRPGPPPSIPAVPIIKMPPNSVVPPIRIPDMRPKQPIPVRTEPTRAPRDPARTEPRSELPRVELPRPEPRVELPRPQPRPEPPTETIVPPAPDIALSPVDPSNVLNNTSAHSSPRENVGSSQSGLPLMSTPGSNIPGLDGHRPPPDSGTIGVIRSDTNRPLSPRDTTPIIANNVEIERSSLTPIPLDPAMIRSRIDNTSPPILPPVTEGSGEATIMMRPPSPRDALPRIPINDDTIIRPASPSQTLQVPSLPPSPRENIPTSSLRTNSPPRQAEHHGTSDSMVHDQPPGQIGDHGTLGRVGFDQPPGQIGGTESAQPVDASTIIRAASPMTIVPVESPLAPPPSLQLPPVDSLPQPDPLPLSHPVEPSIIQEATPSSDHAIILDPPSYIRRPSLVQELPPPPQILHSRRSSLNQDIQLPPPPQLSHVRRPSLVQAELPPPPQISQSRYPAVVQLSSSLPRLDLGSDLVSSPPHPSPRPSVQPSPRSLSIHSSPVPAPQPTQPSPQPSPRGRHSPISLQPPMPQPVPQPPMPQPVPQPPMPQPIPQQPQPFYPVPQQQPQPQPFPSQPQPIPPQPSPYPQAPHYTQPSPQPRSPTNKKKKKKKPPVEPQESPKPKQAVRPNYATMTPAERAVARIDFRIKFSLLRQSLGNRYPFPEPNYEGDMDILYAEYERYLRQLYIDRSANDYSIYIIILFIVIEFLGTKVLGLPLTGYTINQLSMMHRYERLLIELGEKNYSGMGTGWPVEIRIILLSLFNAFVFLLVTSLCSHMGPEVANLALQWINGFMNGQPNRSSAPASAPAPGHLPRI